MKKGKIVALADDPSKERWSAEDAEDHATTTWLMDLFFRWSKANPLQRLPMMEEYYFAFHPVVNREKAKFETALCFREYVRSCRKSPQKRRR